MDKDDSFKNSKFSSKVLIIVVVSALILVTIGFIFGIFYFGIVGLFNVLGVEYNSLWTLFWFTVFYFLLSAFGDLLLEVFLVVTYMSSKWSDYFKRHSIFIYAFFINWAFVSLIDLLMNSIQIELLTQVIFAFLVALLELLFKDQKKHEKRLRER